MAIDTRPLAEKFPPEVRAKLSQSSLDILAFLEAAEAGDDDLVMKLGMSRPIAPSSAKVYRNVCGKDALLASGFDLSWANREYGEGWIDEPEEEWRKKRTK